MKGSLHTHSMYSINDSAMSIKSLLQKAKELGMTSIALTDHGTLLGIDEFTQTKGFEEINKIPGAEVYVSFDANIEGLPKTTTCLEHLVLLSKNNQGYKDICNIVTEANNPKNILRINKKKNIPVVTPDNLLRNLSGGNVIAMTACVQGIIAERFLRDKRTQKELNKLISEKDFNALLSNQAKLLNAIKVSEKKAKKAEGREKDKLETEIALAETKAKEFAKEVKKKTEEMEKRKRLESSLSTEEARLAEARSIAEWFKYVFGQDNLYIELQNHGLEEEAFVAPKLVQIADEFGLKVVATNDVHILNKTENDVLARTISKFNGFEAWFEPEAADYELYLKTEEELMEAIRRLPIPEEKVIEAMNSIDEIAGKCHVEFKQEYHYPVFSAN